MNLFTLIKKSIYDPEFYKSLLERPLSFSFTYFFKITVILAFIFTINVGLITAPLVSRLISKIGPAVVESYPEDLVITIENGKATHNSETPVAIPWNFPEEFEVFQTSTTLPFKNAIVIDTKGPFSQERFKEHQALFVLTNDSLVVSNESGGVDSLESLEKIPNIVINRAEVVSLIGELQPFLRWVVPFLIVGLFFGGLILFTSFLLRILLAVLILWVVARLRSMPLSFKKAYQLCLHAATLPIIFSALLMFLMPSATLSLPFVFTVATLLMVLLNIPRLEYSLPQEESAEEVSKI